MQLKSSLYVENLCKNFGQFKAIDNITFRLPEKGIFGLLGVNGAGKTTLIGMILGLIKPSSGNINVFGKSFKENKFSIMKQINFESPYIDLPKKLSVREILTFYSKMYGVVNYKENITILAKKLKIEIFLDKKFGTLSAGQKTKVGICKSLVNNPRILLLDEPTSSLDPETSIFIRKFLKDYQKKMKSVIIIASHNMTEIENICHSIIVLKAGKIILEGNTKSLILNNRKKNLEELFLTTGK